MMLRRTRTFAIWLAVLIVVYLLIDLLTFSLAWMGSGEGTGILTYRFVTRLHFHYENEAGRNEFGTVNVEGRTEPRFMLWGHVSPQYHHVQIDWAAFGDLGCEGNAVINLREMTIDRDGETVPLTPNGLGSLIGVRNPGDNSDGVVDALIQFLLSARDGTLPVPRHHGYSLPEPLSGSMHHFALGPAIRPLELLWVAAWSAVGFSRLFTRR